jgi:autotransporter-associated beta strand protein
MRETEFAVANKSATVTMNGTFEGSAPLAIGGQGQVTIATEKFFGYTGATILRGGSLYLSTPAIASAGIGSSSKLVMAGGHLKTKGESSGYETSSFPIEVVEGTTSQLSPNRNCYLNNTLTGSGTLQLNIPYLREYVKWNTSNFTGRIVANGISSEKEGSLFLLNTGIRDMSTCVVELRGNARVTSWETNAEVTLGGLSGIAGTYLSGSSKQTNNFKCTWTVGAANSDETFRGIINNCSAGGSGHSGTVSIVKVGTGVWRLTGANEYSGTTQVKAGRLVVNGAHSGTGQVSVMTGGELAGKGSVAGRVAVFDGSILVAGDTLINGTGLTLNNGLSMKAGSVLQCPIYCNGTSSKANRITLKGNVDINDAVLYVDMNDVSSIPDDRGFVLLGLGSATVTGTGFTQIIPERPSPTQEWDTSLLLSKGQLFVRASVPDGIRDLQSVSRDDAPCYDLTGRRVPATSKGLYIQNGKKVMR